MKKGTVNARLSKIESRLHHEDKLRAQLAKGTRENVPLSQEQLGLAILQLTREKPRSLQELCEILREDSVKVSNALAAVRRENRGVINVGMPRRALWYTVKMW